MSIFFSTKAKSKLKPKEQLEDNMSKSNYDTAHKFIEEEKNSFE